MTRKVVSYLECDYQGEKFILLRMAERARFPRGQEVEVLFTGRHPWEGYGMARRAALVYAGLLSTGGKVATFPCVAELGPYRGRVVGGQTGDRKQGWRIDWNPRMGEFHVNWWDRRQDPRGDKDRSTHYYGANYVAGGTQDLFWQIEAHFPGQVEPIVKP